MFNTSNPKGDRTQHNTCCLYPFTVPGITHLKGTVNISYNVSDLIRVYILFGIFITFCKCWGLVLCQKRISIEFAISLNNDKRNKTHVLRIVSFGNRGTFIIIKITYHLCSINYTVFILHCFHVVLDARK